MADGGEMEMRGCARNPLNLRRSNLFRFNLIYPRYTPILPPPYMTFNITFNNRFIALSSPDIEHKKEKFILREKTRKKAKKSHKIPKNFKNTKFSKKCQIFTKKSKIFNNIWEFFCPISFLTFL